jgi:hypothetical protein
MEKIKFKKDVWIITKGDILHGFKLDIGSDLTTPNEYLVYETEQEWIDAKQKLGVIDPFEFEKPQNKTVKVPKEGRVKR